MRNFLLCNPWPRALLPLVFLAVASIATSIFVPEITQEGTIAWATILSKTSFFVLVFAIVATAWYQVAISRFDRAVYKGFTPKQYEASIRNRVAEAVANRSLKLIEDGQIDQLERETETFKRLYGETGK